MNSRALPKKFFRKYTEHARRALEGTVTQDPLGGDSLDLLSAILRERGSLGANILQAHDIRLEKLTHAKARREEKEDPRSSSSYFSRSLKSVLKRAVTLASSYESRYIGTEHLVAALLEEDQIKNLLSNLYPESTIEDLRAELETLLEHSTHFPNLPLFKEEAESPHHELLREKRESFENEGTSLPQRTEHKKEGKALEYFTDDLLARARARALDPLVGREEELERLLTVLSRRSKNNPLLIGEAGVGKTSIVHGLAYRLASQEVPEHLAGRKLRALDLGLLIAGTVFRGEFEARLKDVIKEAQEEDTILFVDEMHTLMGAGSAQGSLDAANMLKPALSTGALQIIGATTIDEYRKHIEKDPAFERRFQPISVEEPGPRDTLKILKGLRPVLEAHHGILISDEMLERTVVLCERYLARRFFPDKAIDVLDEAAASVRSKDRIGGPAARLKMLNDEIRRARHDKADALEKGLYEEATRLKRREGELRRNIGTLKGHQKTTTALGMLTASHIERTVSLMSGIPLEKITHTERQKLLSLERTLKKHIVGQDTAIGELASALRRSRAGVRLPHRPIGSFLFLGPSGVGKTELAKVLARTFFDHPHALIKLDMSEFAEGHTTARILGAPPGYVGFEEQGGFLEKVRRHPHALVLFDEIEKAHSQVHHLLLQILEDGKLTNARGVEVSFKHALIVLTSNIGTARFLGPSALGFSQEEEGAREKLVEEDLKYTLPPELLSRLDHTIVFTPLNSTTVEKIVERELTKLKARLKERNVVLSYTHAVPQYLAKRSYSRRDGARKVRTTLQKLIEDPLTEKLLARGEGALTVGILTSSAGLQWKVSKTRKVSS